MSYVGVVQWLAASRRPPALRGADADDHDGLGRPRAGRSAAACSKSGFLRTWIANSLAPPELRVLDDLDAVAEGGGDLTAIAPWSAPVVRRAGRLGLLGGARPGPGSVSTELPALVIAGWYDCFLGGSLRSFTAPPRPARPPDRRARGVTSRRSRT